jgi:demethylmenaquinone methyltransferase/2-methoxy-6-polyprenyl-1,4-benzoquinol methylase
MPNEALYDPKVVRELFDEMSRTYGLMNILSSFGFTYWWRRRCLSELDRADGGLIVDLMSGMGELCVELRKSDRPFRQVIAVDNSAAMCDLARKNARRHDFDVTEADALACPIETATVDTVVSTFGLKTFSSQQLSILASEVARILRPGGTLSFLEISVPPCLLLRVPFLFYLNRIVPLLGRLFLGNPENYRMLGVYTTAFRDCDHAYSLFAAAGLEVKKRSYFFGCATGIVGCKPLDRSG